MSSRPPEAPRECCAALRNRSNLRWWASMGQSARPSRGFHCFSLIAETALRRDRLQGSIGPRATVCAVIVLLPPSETKRTAGDGTGPGDGSVELTRSRSAAHRTGRRADRPCGRPTGSRRALGISTAQDAEIDRNAALRTGADMPAIDRYTGVLYDALGIETRCAAPLPPGQGRGWPSSRPCSGWCVPMT